MFLIFHRKHVPYFLFAFFSVNSSAIIADDIKIWPKILVVWTLIIHGKYNFFISPHKSKNKSTPAQKLNKNTSFSKSYNNVLLFHHCKFNIHPPKNKKENLKLTYFKNSFCKLFRVQCTYVRPHFNQQLNTFMLPPNNALCKQIH